MISAPQHNILMTLKDYGKGGDMCGYGFGVVCFFILKNKSKNLKVNLAPYRSLWTLAVMIRWWGQKQSGVGCQVNRR